MQYLNRPPKEDNTPQSVSYKGANLPQDIFKHECIPFAIGSIITVAVVTFDLITDWLAWRTFSTFDFSDLIQQSLDNIETQGSFWGLDNLYLKLPVIYLAICIAASVVYILEVVRLLREFFLQRQTLKENLDGVPYKRNILDRYGGDVMLLLQVIIEDLPISLILLAVQAAISCTFVIPINSAIFVLSASATCVSVCWKLGQVIWRAGCLGQREEYECKISQGLLRGTSAFFLLSSFSVVVLNILLLTSPGKKSSLPNHPLLDKIGIDRWIREDHITLTLKQSVTESSTSIPLPWPQNHRDDGQVPEHQSQDMYLEYSNVIRLKDIIENDLHNLTFFKPCHSFGNSIQLFIPPEHQTKFTSKHQWLCSFVFRFSYSSVNKTVFYNLMYRFQQRNNLDKCVAGHFIARTLREDSGSGSGQNRTGVEDLATLESTPSASDTHNATLLVPPATTSVTSSPNTTEQLLIQLELALSPAWRHSWVKCAFQLVLDATNLHMSPCDLYYPPEISLL